MFIWAADWNTIEKKCTIMLFIICFLAIFDDSSSDEDIVKNAYRARLLIGFALVFFSDIINSRYHIAMLSSEPPIPLIKSFSYFIPELK